MGVTAKKEWTGESGYCNCLLVVMARLSVPFLDLFSDRPVPNLETLASGRPTTASWIRAQEFQYSSLNPLFVIEIFMGIGQISSFLWWYKPGYLEVYDVVEDDGPMVKRTYRMRLSKKRGILHLKIEL
jgi:hypothetical protein